MAIDVKVCGIRRREDAELAAELGAFALGFVFDKFSPRLVGDADWHPDWVAALPVKRVAVFGVVYPWTPHPDFEVIQGVEWPNPLPEGRQIWKAFRLRSTTKLEEVLEALEGADALLLDSYVPGRYGGTGHVADWGLAAEIARELKGKVRLGLAGGLKPENVALAIERVQPDYVDVSSGVEVEHGVKDPDKLRSFFAAVR